MIKYTVMVERFEFKRNKYNGVENAYFAQDYHNAQRIAQFDTHEDAADYLSSVGVRTDIYGDNAVASVAFIEEASWEWNDVHEELQFCYGSDILDFKCQEIGTN